eukprot:gene6880-9426_t
MTRLFADNFATHSTSSQQGKIKADNSKVIQRIDRIIANRGVGTRSEVTTLFRQGKVKINGKVIRSPSERIRVDAEIEVNGVTSRETPLIAVYHKPVGIHSTVGDPWGRPSLLEVKNSIPVLQNMHPVGRLDADTSGLLLFSSDGLLSNLLLQPVTAVERTYEAIVCGSIDHISLKSNLLNGIKTSDGIYPADLISSSSIPNNEIDDILQLQLENSLKFDKKYTDSKNHIENDEEQDNDIILPNKELITSVSKVILSVKEGKYRMVRRILHNAGHSVIRLHRVSYGPFSLCDALSGIVLEEGAVRICSDLEKNWIKLFLQKNKNKSK